MSQLVTNPVAKQILALIIAIFAAYGYHRMLVAFRGGRPGALGTARDALVRHQQAQLAMDFFMVNAFGKSFSGILRHRHMVAAGRTEIPTGAQLGYYPKPPGRG